MTMKNTTKDEKDKPANAQGFGARIDVKTLTTCCTCNYVYVSTMLTFVNFLYKLVSTHRLVSDADGYSI